MSISEHEMLEAWSASIRPEHRAERPRSTGGPRKPSTSPSGKSGVQGSRLKKQALYASVCLPQRDGDEELLTLYGNGKSLASITFVTGLSYDVVSRRIRNCHPDKQPLNAVTVELIEAVAKNMGKSHIKANSAANSAIYSKRGNGLDPTHWMPIPAPPI